MICDLERTDVVRTRSTLCDTQTNSCEVSCATTNTAELLTRTELQIARGHLAIDTFTHKGVFRYLR